MSLVNFDRFKEYGDATKEYFLALINGLDARLETLEQMNTDNSYAALLAINEDETEVLVDDDEAIILADWEHEYASTAEVMYADLSQKIEVLSAAVSTLSAAVVKAN